MKRTAAALAFFVSLYAAFARGASFAQDGGTPAPAAQEEPADPLTEAMEAIEESLGRLRRALREDAQVEEGLAAVADMQAAALRAKLLAPPLLARAPEGERAGLLRDYRKLMIELVSSQLALETALLDGDLEAARELFKEVRAFEDRGHERFTEDG